MQNVPRLVEYTILTFRLNTAMDAAAASFPETRDDLLRELSVMGANVPEESTMYDLAALLAKAYRDHWLKTVSEKPVATGIPDYGVLAVAVSGEGVVAQIQKEFKTGNLFFVAAARVRVDSHVICPYGTENFVVFIGESIVAVNKEGAVVEVLSSGEKVPRLLTANRDSTSFVWADGKRVSHYRVLVEFGTEVYDIRRTTCDIETDSIQLSPNGTKVYLRSKESLRVWNWVNNYTGPVIDGSLSVWGYVAFGVSDTHCILHQSFGGKGYVAFRDEKVVDAEVVRVSPGVFTIGGVETRVSEF